MREISVSRIKDAVCELSLKANLILRPDVLRVLKKLYRTEKNIRSKKIIKAIIENASFARNESMAICQDTGFTCVFMEIGQDVRITSGDLNSAVNTGVSEGYKKGCFRNSIVKDPLLRGKSGYSPAVIHTDIVKGNKIKITVLPKGFGCENKTQLKMFKPTVTEDEVKKFIVQAVKDAGPDACPPYVVGVGIGGTADYVTLLAKKALLGNINIKTSVFEKDLLARINKLNIGPMGLGGKATCLAVKVQTYPTHIAGLPVCVSISCHALRSATKII
ncbi:fumarate hydratase [bacterium]|nr:MAG: fumarate hydratase [bacterium]